MKLTRTRYYHLFLRTHLSFASCSSDSLFGKTFGSKSHAVFSCHDSSVSVNLDQFLSLSSTFSTFEDGQPAVLQVSVSLMLTHERIHQGRLRLWSSLSASVGAARSANFLLTTCLPFRSAAVLCTARVWDGCLSYLPPTQQKPWWLLPNRPQKTLQTCPCSRSRTACPASWLLCEDRDAHVVKDGGTEASSQQPCEWTILEAGCQAFTWQRPQLSQHHESQSENHHQLSHSGSWSQKD